MRILTWLGALPQIDGTFISYLQKLWRQYGLAAQVKNIHLMMDAAEAEHARVTNEKIVEYLIVDVEMDGGESVGER